MSAQPVDVLALLDRVAGRNVASAEAWFAKDAVAELIEAARITHAFLTQPEWGLSEYMEGSKVDDDLERHAALLQSALARVGGAS
jgi:hypothetical protein